MNHNIYQHCHASREVSAAGANIQHVSTIVHHVGQQLQRMSMLQQQKTLTHSAISTAILAQLLACKLAGANLGNFPGK